MAIVNIIPISITLTLVSATHGGQELHSVGLEKIANLLRGNVRLIAMGDSYSVPYYQRVPAAGLCVWPIQNITALGGAVSVGPSIVRCDVRCSPYDNVISSDKLGYMVERQEVEQSYYTLPILGLKEIYTDESFVAGKDGSLFEFTLSVDELETSVHGPFYNPESFLHVRLLYRAPNDALTQPQSLQLRDSGSDELLFSPGTDARKLWHQGDIPDGQGQLATSRQMNAVAFDFPTTNNVEDLFRVQLAETSPLSGTNDYFDLAGAVYYYTENGVEPKPGMYYSSLADGSWQFGGFGSNEEGEGAQDKQFSLEQCTHWLDVTTLHRDQPVLFLWFFASESLLYDAIYERMSNMMNQADDAANLVGLTSVEHLLVVPHLFNMIGHDIEETRQYILNQQEAAFDLASTRNNVAAVSLFSATDGVYFIGGSESREWLASHGYELFEYGSNSCNLIDETNGDMLDNWNVHPKDSLSAIFFASIIGNLIRESACPSDIVVDGIINVQDMLYVIDNWGEQGDSDINQDGTTNVVDLLMVVDQWGDCWPVQAPYACADVFGDCLPAPSPYNSPPLRSMQLERIPLHSGLLDQSESHSRGVAGQ